MESASEISKNSEAEVYFQGIKLVNAVNDTTKFPPVDIMPWIKYIPRWLAPVNAFHGCTINVADDFSGRLIVTL